MADVLLNNVSKRFGATLALDGVDLRINDGELVVLLGPTGTGKTTTLRVVAGLESPDSGEVVIDGENVNGIAPAGRDVSFVFQQYSLYPHFSVFENLAFPLKSPARKRKRNAAEIDRRVREVAALLSIESKLDNKATALSGGEMQRVAIGRALVRNPSIFLMDEPLSSLDAKLRGELRVELKRIQQDQGATILYVTHDQIEAMTMASRIGVLRDGRVVQFGSPRDIYQDPDSEYVATRLGVPPINIVPAAALPVAETPPLRAAHRIGVRSEHIKLVAPDAAGGAEAIGEIASVEQLGDQTRIGIDVRGANGEDTRLITLAELNRRYRVGERFALKIDNPLYFDEHGDRLRA